MTGFVTWPLFHTIIINKGGQVTKPIIFVKICYKLLYICHQVDNRFLISNFLASTDIKIFGRHIPICNAASDWPRTFFIPRVFLFSICIYMHTTYIAVYFYC